MLQDTIVCDNASSNVYTSARSNQAFALYPELKGKGKGKTRLSWRVSDYPNHKNEINTHAAFWSSRQHAFEFAKIVVSRMTKEQAGKHVVVRKLCKELKADMTKHGITPS
jgi:hypothetical protein|tara:strand:+ start:759 stop:1088 length:330 start_codon:yes stop_codon:yes gene_type:complete